MTVAVLGEALIDFIVGDDGAWEADLPIPSFLRRYPMIALNVKSGPDSDAPAQSTIRSPIVSINPDFCIFSPNT